MLVSPDSRKHPQSGYQYIRFRASDCSRTDIRGEGLLVFRSWKRCFHRADAITQEEGEREGKREDGIENV